MRESESEFQRWVIDAARTFGWKCAHFRTARVQRRDGSTHYATPVQADGAGFPDLVLVHPRAGVVIFAELKSDRGRLSAAQVAWGDALAAACDGARVRYSVWRPRDADAIVDLLARKEGPDARTGP